VNQEPNVYKIGIYRDLEKLKRQGFKIFWYWFKSSWMRRSYWNGYLAETENKSRCGRGWTKKQAIRSWKRIPEL
jgi:hypothetical protein